MRSTILSESVPVFQAKPDRLAPFPIPQLPTEAADLVLPTRAPSHISVVGAGLVPALVHALLSFTYNTTVGADLVPALVHALLSFTHSSSVGAGLVPALVLALLSFTYYTSVGAGLVPALVLALLSFTHSSTVGAGLVPALVYPHSGRHHFRLRSIGNAPKSGTDPVSPLLVWVSPAP